MYPFKDSGAAASNEKPSSAFRAQELHNFNRRPGINDDVNKDYRNYNYKAQYPDQLQNQYRPYQEPPATRWPTYNEQQQINYYRDEEQPVPIAYRPSSATRPTAPPHGRDEDSGKAKLVVHLNVYNQKDAGGGGNPLVFL